MKEDINIYQARCSNVAQSTPLVPCLSCSKYKQNTPLPNYTLVGTRVLLFRLLLYFCYKLTCTSVIRLPGKLDTSFGSIISPKEVAKCGLDLLLYLG